MGRSRGAGNAHFIILSLAKDTAAHAMSQPSVGKTVAFQRQIEKTAGV